MNFPQKMNFPFTVQEQNSYFPLREKRRATRNHLGFCAGTEGGKCRTSDCGFAWEQGEGSRLYGKMDEPTPKEIPKNEERDSPTRSIALFSANPSASSGFFSSPTFTSRETGTANPRKVLYRCVTVHSLVPIKILWM